MQYYKPTKTEHKIYASNGVELTPKERGLDYPCPENKDGHGWLLTPKQKGQKQYLFCIHCFGITHT